MNNDLQKAFRWIKDAGKVLVVTHNKPDGDAASSICAMSELLVGLGKDFTAYCFDGLPPSFRYLPHHESIVNEKDFVFREFDLIIALDCGSLNRTKLAEEIRTREQNQRVVEFDHHPRMDNFADLELRDPGLSSTAELLYNFFKANKVKLNKNYANCILTGILTDTGNFLYPSTSDRTVRIASEMLLYGARFPEIVENTWRNKSLAGMKIWGAAINNLKVNKKYNFAVSILTHDDIMENEASDEELEGIAGFLSNLHGVDGLLLLREEEPGKIKGSLRARNDNVDVSILARKLGGGGHPKASGFALNGRLQKKDGAWQVKA